MYTMELVLDRQTKQPVRKFNQKIRPQSGQRSGLFPVREKKHLYTIRQIRAMDNPSLIVTKSEIDTLLEAFDEALEITDKAAAAITMKITRIKYDLYYCWQWHYGTSPGCCSARTRLLGTLA